MEETSASAASVMVKGTMEAFCTLLFLPCPAQAPNWVKIRKQSVEPVFSGTWGINKHNRVVAKGITDPKIGNYLKRLVLYNQRNIFFFPLRARVLCFFPLSSFPANICLKMLIFLSLMIALVLVGSEILKNIKICS